MACAEQGAVATGHGPLDIELPGGGWPLGLVEVLQERPEQHVWQLTAPALAHSLLSQVGPVVLVAAPFAPFVAGLQARGIAGDRLLWIRATRTAERLWAAEQALRCAEVAAVLAWLPQAKGAELRRLQMAAQQHKHLLFVFRGLRCAQESSPARVRLQVTGSEQMELTILKRRGPPMERPLLLPAQPARLAALLQARRRRPSAIPMPPTPAPASSTSRRPHVVGRFAAIE